MAAVITEIGSAVVRLPGWWLGELAALVPRPVRAAFREQQRWIVLDLSGGNLAVSHVKGARGQALGELALSGDTGEERGAVQHLVRRFKSDQAVVVLRLGEDQALRRTVSLPLAAEENLRQVLGFEMDRQTPFKPDEVYFDFSVVGRDQERERLTVELTVARRAVVDAAVERARSWGLAPDVVDVAGESATLGALNLLPAERQTSAGRGRAALNLLLVGVALGLAGAAVDVAIKRQEAVVATMQQRLAAARSEAEAAQALRARLDGLIADQRFLDDRKREQVATTRLLDELTKVVPDHTWVYQLRVDGANVQLWGYSSASSEVLSTIERSPMFTDARFRSPVTQDARMGLERFNLSARMTATGEKGG